MFHIALAGIYAFVPFIAWALGGLLGFIAVLDKQNLRCYNSKQVLGVNFMSIDLVNLEIANIPQEHQEEAENKAKEAYIMILLKYHHISAGKAAKLLGVNRWELSNLMSVYNISPFPEQTYEDLEREVTQTLEILEFRK